MLKEDDLPPHLRQQDAPPQPVLEAELPLEVPAEAPASVEAPEDTPPEPYLRTS